MWALVVFLHIQQGLDVILVNTRTDREFRIEQDCWDAVQKMPVLLPLQPGNDARWQYSTCVKFRP